VSVDAGGLSASFVAISAPIGDGFGGLGSVARGAAGLASEEMAEEEGAEMFEEGGDGLEGVAEGESGSAMMVAAAERVAETLSVAFDVLVVFSVLGFEDLNGGLGGFLL